MASKWRVYRGAQLWSTNQPRPLHPAVDRRRAVRLASRHTLTFLATPFNESEPAFSPDGRWLAYQSKETGRFEVYVRSFPGPGGRWQVSTAGGEMPTWSPKGKELLFRVDQQVMVVEYASAKEGSFSVSAPRRWSETRLTDLGSGVRNFDVHPDGQRVLAVISPQGDATRTEVVYVSNFFDELRRRAPVKK